MKEIVVLSTLQSIGFGLFCLGLGFGVNVLLDRANGSNFRDQLELIRAGNSAVAIYEGMKFFAIAYLMAAIIK